jgi:hypothetical protein
MSRSQVRLRIVAGHPEDGHRHPLRRQIAVEHGIHDPDRQRHPVAAHLLSKRLRHGLWAEQLQEGALDVGVRYHDWCAQLPRGAFGGTDLDAGHRTAAHLDPRHLMPQ